MINLEPIPKEIQKRLFEKMRALGRQGPSAPNSSVSTETLTHDKMATRSTFVRMTSGQVNPVTLMGGSLKQDGGIRGGYDEIYGSREYKQSFSTLEEYEEYDFDNFFDENKDLESTTVNQNGTRPMPGVKSIDVQFKGGLRAFRDATVNWTCWDWKELVELTPHFLAHGKTVMLQWGWVYDENSIKNIPNFITTDTSGGGSGISFIDESAYTDYKNKVIEGKGDFDLMVGIVKNFEYTTRDDGGFDCTTTLTSIGVNIMDNPEPNASQIPTYLKTNLSVSDKTDENFKRLLDATRDEDENEQLNNKEKNKLIGLSTNVSFKVFLRNIHTYLEERLIYDENTKQDTASSTVTEGSFAWIPNKFLVYVPQFREDSSEEDSTLLDAIKKQEDFKIDYELGENPSQRPTPIFDDNNSKVWVSWGWFEDNIMSKFATQVSKSSNKVINTFRSIERILRSDGEESARYESVRIANHEFLETIDPSIYILPGQFFPQETKRYKNPDGNDFIKIDGDLRPIKKMAEIVNKQENFQRFASTNDFIVETSFVMDEADVVNENLKNIGYDTDMSDEEFESLYNRTTEAQLATEERFVSKPDNFGYLRNMLISLDSIKEAFGVGELNNAFTTETVSISEGIESLFSILNRPIPFWDFGLTTDSVDTNNVKIIDQTTTKFDFSKSVDSQRTRTANGETFTNDGGQDFGVFFFPVWRSDSIVKRQNVTAKVPNAMALTAMYGSNLDQFSEVSNIGGKYSDTGVVLMGGLNNNDSDRRMGGLVTAIQSETDEDSSWSNIGNENYFQNKKLGKKGDNILSFIKRYGDALKTQYDDIKNTVDDELIAAKYLKKQDEIDSEYRKSFDPSKPPPLLNQLDDGDVYRLLKALKDNRGNTNWLLKLFGAGNAEADKEIKNLEALLSSKYDGKAVEGNFKMKRPFVQTIKFLTSGQRGEIKDSKASVLIPLDIELDVDGTGGIYPGNSFHSTYLPTRYKNKTVFQAFDISHKVDGSTWTTTISGRMRSTLNNVFDGLQDFNETNRNMVENFIEKIVGTRKKGNQEVILGRQRRLEEFKKRGGFKNEKVFTNLR